MPLAWSADEDVARCVAQLDEWHARGVRLRPRAVVTTMFARLVLSDIFIHGIGGAKYDQLTDAIVRRFFGVEPPEYLVATATFKLPLPRHGVEEADIARIDLLLRELRYHPELYVDGRAEARQLIAEKRQWVAQQVPREQRSERHAAIERANHALHALLHDRRSAIARRTQRTPLAAPPASDPRFARVPVLFVPRRDFADTATGTFAPRTVTYGECGSIGGKDSGRSAASSTRRGAATARILHLDSQTMRGSASCESACGRDSET